VNVKFHSGLNTVVRYIYDFLKRYMKTGKEAVGKGKYWAIGVLIIVVLIVLFYKPGALLSPDDTLPIIYREDREGIPYSDPRMVEVCMWRVINVEYEYLPKNPGKEYYCKCTSENENDNSFEVLLGPYHPGGPKDISPYEKAKEICGIKLREAVKKDNEGRDPDSQISAADFPCVVTEASSLLDDASSDEEKGEIACNFAKIMLAEEVEKRRPICKEECSLERFLRFHAIASKGVNEEVFCSATDYYECGKPKPLVSVDSVEATRSPQEALA